VTDPLHDHEAVKTRFVGPDGAEYEYADPADAPTMDGVDSTSIEAPEGAPVEELPVAGESTPGGDAR